MTHASTLQTGEPKILFFKVVYYVSDFFRRACYRMSNRCTITGNWIDNHVTLRAYHRARLWKR